MVTNKKSYPKYNEKFYKYLYFTIYKVIYIIYLYFYGCLCCYIKALPRPDGTNKY